MKTTKVPIAKYAVNQNVRVKPQKEVWCMDHQAITKWTRAGQRMKAHASSENHFRHLEAELTAKKGGSIVHQLQHIR